MSVDETLLVLWYYCVSYLGALVCSTHVACLSCREQLNLVCNNFALTGQRSLDRPRGSGPAKENCLLMKHCWSCGITVFLITLSQALLSTLALISDNKLWSHYC
jgi:hypothetical protein